MGAYWTVWSIRLNLNESFVQVRGKPIEWRCYCGWKAFIRSNLHDINVVSLFLAVMAVFTYHYRKSEYTNLSLIELSYESRNAVIGKCMDHIAYNDSCCFVKPKCQHYWEITVDTQSIQINSLVIVVCHEHTEIYALTINILSKHELALVVYLR